jgi:VIT1/CCC1 family predicted Fe2+/Mn2+ transporter
MTMTTAAELHQHALRAAHTPAAVRQRLLDGPRHSYLRDFVYGGIDGAVTTFAVVAGVAGAGLSSTIILVLGIANLIADGFSMAASNYLGTRAEQDVRRRVRREEEAHIERIPEGEREEVRQLFAAKGFDGPDLDRAVEIITSDRQRWLDTMVREEFGMSLEGPAPARAALTTFAAFVVVGSLPLLAFVVDATRLVTVPRPFVVSAVLTGLAMFLVGALKSRVVRRRWYGAGLESLFVGGAAAALAYVVGFWLAGLGVDE